MKKRNIAAVVTSKNLRDTSSDVAYWRRQPYSERLSAVEEIRLDYHRWKDDVQPGLQRVYRIIKRQPG